MAYDPHPFPSAASAASTVHTVGDKDTEDQIMASIPPIRRETIHLQDLKMECVRDDNNRKQFTLGVKDQAMAYSDRFGRSLLGLLGQSSSVFDLYDPEEVLQRAIDRNKLAEITVSMEERPGLNRALAATSPDKNRVGIDTVKSLLGLSIKHRGGPSGITGFGYNDGAVTYRLNPTVGDGKFDVKGDEIFSQFFVDVPIDGYGDPNIYLGFLRMVCSNGAMLLSKAFRSKIPLGKSDPEYTLRNHFMTFPDDGGFQAVQDRLKASTEWHASMDEFYRFQQILLRKDSDHDSDPANRIIKNLGGSFLNIYGVTSMDAISHKVRQRIKLDATVYDLLNAATEIATHHSGPRTALALNSFSGVLMASEYDLENMKPVIGDYSPRDVFINDNEATKATEAKDNYDDLLSPSHGVSLAS